MNKAITLLFLQFFCQSIIGQNTIGIPQIINYDKNDFRAGSQTWDIDQDNSGRMYFANNEGLVTFDGNYWKLHPLPNKTIVRSIAIDQHGVVYTGGQGELGYFKPDNKGNLTYTSLIPLLPQQYQTFSDVWDIEILGGSIFFRAAERIILELKNNHFSVYPAISAWKLLRKANGKIYAQDETEGIYVFNNEKWIPVKNNSLIKRSTLSALMGSENEEILLFSNEFQAYRLIKGDSLTINNDFVYLNNKITVSKSTIINKNEFAISTTSEGILVMNKNGELIQRITRKEGLQNNNVICAFFDKDGNLWAGLNNGISFIAYNAAIKFIRPKPDDDVAGFSTALYENQLFIGSSDGAYKALIRDESNDLGFSKGSFSKIDQSEGQVWRIEEVNGKILMAHNNGCFEIANSRANRMSKDAGWLFVPMSKISPSKNILVGTYAGLKMLEFANNKFTDSGNLDGIYESLRFITLDNDGKIWASHPYRGIYLITLSPDQKKYTAELFTEKDGLPSSLGNHVYKIKNRVVFATSKGVYEFDAKKRRFIKASFLNEIFKNIEVRYLTEDKEGNIWFCSGKKIGVIDQEEKGSQTITYFPELSGLVLSGFENIYPYNNENIFIASEKGVVLLNYEKYKANKNKPVVLLGNIKASGKIDTSIFGGYLIKDKLANKIDEDLDAVTLSSNFNSFHFEFSSPAYGIQKNIVYSYKLDGYDKKWSDWSSKSEKDYTNLSYGNYTFNVKAKDNLGNESAEVQYAFYVTPPWYRTYLAYFVYLLFIGLSIHFIRQYQRKKLLRQKLIYLEKQRQMNVLHQLEIEKNEKEIIKLRNEKLESEILLKTKELADTSIQLVERSDALVKVKEELQKMYRNTNENHDIKKALHWLNDIEKNTASWEKFASHFDEINNNFLKNLKSSFPKLTNTDLKVCAYLQLNLSSKEISQLMNISVRGVEISRYRLRKKLGLSQDQSIAEFLEQYKQG
jgi:ligand-binding sensor domain-containing protein/DNA-binding CsgD family transcriptional regulator